MTTSTRHLVQHFADRTCPFWDTLSKHATPQSARRALIKVLIEVHNKALREGVSLEERRRRYDPATIEVVEAKIIDAELRVEVQVDRDTYRINPVQGSL